MAGEQPTDDRLSGAELRAELERARALIADLETDRAQSHERLIGSLANHLNEGFSLMSPVGVQLDVKPAFCAMVGLSREEFIGRGIPQPYSPPEEHDANSRAFRNLLDEEGVTSVEATFMRKDGERFPVLITPTVVRDDAGEPVYLFATIKDMSERKHAEDALRESEARYRKLVGGMLEGLAYCRMIRDADGHPADWEHLAVNPAFERLTGLHGASSDHARKMSPDSLIRRSVCLLPPPRIP
jgi:PAS domain S-box-containing protein